MSKINIDGIIISAGLSVRMNSFKPLAIYKGKSFLNNIISKLSCICNTVIIVTGHESEKLHSEIKKELTDKYKNLRFVYNELYRKGMFTSLQKGVSAAKGCDWVLYHFVDQPGVPPEFYSDFISQIDEKHNWIQPMNNERKGHPILLRKDLIEFITSEPEGSNLRKLSCSRAFKKKFWECIYTEILQDIDTEEDYLKLE